MTEAEFIELIHKHAGIIHKILFLHLDNKEDRADMLQEIKLQAWKAIGRFRGDAQFGTWLYRVALNTVFTYNRKKRIKTTELVQDNLILASAPEPSEKADLLLHSIKQLSTVDKTIISLHLDGYDNGEIADILGLSKNHIGVKLHRIKDGLKKKLNPQDHG